MALKWINDYCKNAKFILKTDDDIIVNTFALINHLKLLNNRIKIKNSVKIILNILFLYF
jgi:hypothetical protein